MSLVKSFKLLCILSLSSLDYIIRSRQSISISHNLNLPKGSSNLGSNHACAPCLAPEHGNKPWLTLSLLLQCAFVLHFYLRFNLFIKKKLLRNFDLSLSYILYCMKHSTQYRKVHKLLLDIGPKRYSYPASLHSNVWSISSIVTISLTCNLNYFRICNKEDCIFS